MAVAKIVSILIIQSYLLIGQDERDKTLVSVITPVYNMELYLRRYLESVLSQTYSPIELILVNDGSTDNSEQITKSYFPALEKNLVSVKYIGKENEGLGAAINTGLQVFTGSYLIWPDSDDFMGDRLLEKMVAFLKENTQYSLVRVNVNLWREGNGRLIYSGTIAGKNKNRFKKNLFDTLVFEKSGCWLTPGSYMVRTDAFVKSNPLKKIYPFRRGQNWQILLPVVYHAKCGYVDKALHNYVIRKVSMHSDFSVRDMLHRCDEHENMLLNTIKLIDGLNLKKYTKLIRDKYNQKRSKIMMKYNKEKQVLKRIRKSKRQERSKNAGHE